MSGEAFYSDVASGISVDRDFARFGSKSYAIDKITSTDIRKRQPFLLPGLMLIGIGLLLFMAGLGGFSGGLLIGAVLLAAGIWLCTRENYALYVVTSAHEVSAYVSADKTLITELKNAIEQAMVVSKPS